MRQVYFAFLSAALLFSGVAFAADCPDLTGEYEYASVKQVACEKLTLTQHFPDGDVMDEILLDNVYRTLPSMPQFQTAFTYNPYMLVGTSKSGTTTVRIFTLSLTAEGDLLGQRIILDNKGDIVSTDGWADKRKTLKP
jgi:hypothetical protein